MLLRPEVDKQTANRITNIVMNHQFKKTPDEKEAMSIIYPAVDPLPEDYVRPACRRDKHAMIHWYYFPESFLTWVLNKFDLQVNIPSSPLSSGTVGAYRPSRPPT
uniref:SWI/SNF complex subunit SMARCC2 n=1 Tax=Culex pipiens TaxID=7175 RepID=A0A8D8C6C4_CULPI